MAFDDGGGGLGGGGGTFVVFDDGGEVTCVVFDDGGEVTFVVFDDGGEVTFVVFDDDGGGGDVNISPETSKALVHWQSERSPIPRAPIMLEPQHFTVPSESVAHVNS